MLAVVSTPIPITNMAYQIGMSIFSHRFLSTAIQHVVVVDPDVDPFNVPQVMHALATQCHPKRGIRIVDKPTIGFVPHLSMEARLWWEGAGAIYDCTFPIRWKKGVETPVKSGFKTIYWQEAQARALELVQKYGTKRV